MVVGNNGRIVFENEVELRTNDLTVSSAFITGAGSLVVDDVFTKTSDLTADSFFVTNEVQGGPAPDLVLDGPSSINSGLMCISRSDDASPDNPSLTIDGTFTIVDPSGTLGSLPFGCSGSGIRVTENGHLIHDADRESRLATMVDNDGTITAQRGRLILSGGTGGQSSGGDYVAAETAEMRFGPAAARPSRSGRPGASAGRARRSSAGRSRSTTARSWPRARAPTRRAQRARSTSTSPPANRTVWRSRARPPSAARSSRCRPPASIPRRAPRSES